MKVIPLFCFNQLRNFSYLIIGSKKSVCVDPYDAGIINEYLTTHGIKLDYIVNTHSHHDHIRGNEELIELTNAQIIKLDINDELSIGTNDTLVVLPTPGHTMDHVCFIGKENGKEVFCMAGDTLFNAGLGNCKNGGIKEVLFDTIMKLKEEFTDEMMIYPGHDYLQSNIKFAKSIDSLNEIQQGYLDRVACAENGDFPFLSFGEIKKINPFLQITTKEDFLNLRNLRDNW